MIRRPPRPTLFPYPTLSRPPRERRRDAGDEPRVARPADLRDEGEIEADPPERSGAGHEGDGAYGWVGLYLDRKSTRLNSSHVRISYAVFCLKKKQTPHDARA